MKHLQLRLEDDEYKAFEDHCDLLGLSLQAGGRKAIERWANETEAAETKAEESQFVKSLLYFLREGNPDVREAVKALLSSAPAASKYRPAEALKDKTAQRKKAS